MAESTPQAGQQEGYKPNTETVMLELHRLLAIFLSSQKFAELRTGCGETWDSISHLQSFEEDEVTRILLAVAITARVIDDRERRVFDPVAESCGILARYGADKEVIESLSLREACNKLIHAQKIRFDVDETESRQRYLNPFIYLYGEQSGKAWKATLDVVAFAKEYCACVRET